MEFFYVFVLHKIFMNFSYIMYIGLEYVMASPKKVLSSFVLYCKNFGRLKISNGFIFGHYFCPKLKSSEIFCK